jgi:hypothetical protein
MVGELRKEERRIKPLSGHCPVICPVERACKDGPREPRRGQNRGRDGKKRICGRFVGS